MKHPYVPLVVLALVPLGEDTRKGIAEHCCVQVGNAIEVDTHAAEAHHAGAGKLLSDYFDSSRQLWDEVSRGDTTRASVTVERVLYTERQLDTREARVYLHDTAVLLAETNGFEPVSAMLETEPKWGSIRRQGKLHRRGNDSTFTMRCPARHYPSSLGGVRSRGETARYVTVTTSHAGWRDSRARRLTSLTITAHELWPDPREWETHD